MSTPAFPRLQPLGLGQLLDQSIRLYRRNFLTFIGIIALMQVPVALLQLLASLLSINGLAPALNSTRPNDPSQMFTPQYFSGLGLTFLVTVASFVLVSGVASAAMTRAVADSYLGQPVSITGAYRRIGQAWPRLLGTLLLSGLIVIGLLIWFIIPCAGWLTGLGILLFYSLVIQPLAVPIVVLEQRGGSYALRRAWNMARQRFWWVLGFVVILMLFAQLVITGPTTVLTWIFQGLLRDPSRLGQASTLLLVQTILQSLVSLVFGLLYLPLQLAGLTLLYFDLRVRHEGFDLALLAQAEAAEPAEVAALTAAAPAAEVRSLVSSKELGYFVVLTVGGAAAYFVLIGVLGAIGLGVMTLVSGSAFAP